MKSVHIRFIVVLGTFSLLSILLTQVYWAQTSIQNRNEVFGHNVKMALRNVVESLCILNGNDVTNDPIDQVSANYFIARTSYNIDLNSLEYLLKAELQKRNLDEDFEFGVYDCNSDRMVYGDLVHMSDASGTIKRGSILPKLVEDEYYFGVFFPNVKGGSVLTSNFWLISTLVTFIIFVFFGYALFIIFQQKRLSEVQKDFINNITHELKTPLSTLQLSSKALQQEVTSERGKKYLTIVGNESNRLLNHVNRLLNMSSEGDSESFTTIALNKHVESCVLSISVSNESIKWNLCLDQAEPHIFGNETLLQTVIFNLLDNAIKYGNGEISVKTSNDKLPKLIVSDNGPGVPEKDLKRVFQKFYRISKGDLHDVKGFGLGLYLVKQALKKMRAKISVKNMNGAYFVITFYKTHE